MVAPHQKLGCPSMRGQRAVALLGLLLAFSSSSSSGWASAESVGYGELEEEWRGEIEQLSWKPRAFLAKGFLSDEECEHIKDIARPKLEVSAVVDSATGQSRQSEVRTSTGAFCGRGYDDVLRRIEKRIAQVTMLPVENQEGLQVLRYVDGQKYEAHYDYFHDTVNSKIENGGQRVVTMLMYLSTPDAGGETVFPDAERKSTGPGLSECALKGLANKPKKGDALMFYSLTPDGKKDSTSLHGSCPTLGGEKWSATKWIHVAPFGGPAPAPPPDAHGCSDTHPQCAEWAYFNECEKNPGYMLVGCKKSCKVCATAAASAAAAGHQHAATDKVVDVPIKTE